VGGSGSSVSGHCCPLLAVRKVGAKFIIYDFDNNIVGEAEPGFKPTPQDAECCEKVEYARARPDLSL